MKNLVTIFVLLLTSACGLDADIETDESSLKPGKKIELNDSSIYIQIHVPLKATKMTEMKSLTNYLIDSRNSGSIEDLVLINDASQTNSRFCFKVPNNRRFEDLVAELPIIQDESKSVYFYFEFVDDCKVEYPN